MSTPDEVRREYIIRCLREAGGTHEDGARAVLASHDEARRTEVLKKAADWLAEHGQPDAAYLLRTCDVPAAGDVAAPEGNGTQLPPCANCRHASRDHGPDGCAQFGLTSWTGCKCHGYAAAQPETDTATICYSLDGQLAAEVTIRFDSQLTEEGRKHLAEAVRAATISGLGFRAGGVS